MIYTIQNIIKMMWFLRDALVQTTIPAVDALHESHRLAEFICGQCTHVCLRISGHEQPFAIQLSHERDPEDLDPNVKCQFILRENKKQMKLGKYTVMSLFIWRDFPTCDVIVYEVIPLDFSLNLLTRQNMNSGCSQPLGR